MKIREIITRCRLACGAESEAMGYPMQAGYDLYEGCVKDDLEKWSEDTFLDWVTEMERLYGKSSQTGHRLIDLYKRCNEIMGQYGKLV